MQVRDAWQASRQPQEMHWYEKVLHYCLPTWFRNYTVTERVLLCLGGKAVHHADIGLDLFEDSVFIVVEKINGDIRHKRFCLDRNW